MIRLHIEKITQISVIIKEAKIMKFKCLQIIRIHPIEALFGILLLLVMLLEKIELLQVTAVINKQSSIRLVGNRTLKTCLDLVMIQRKMVVSWKNSAKLKIQ